MSGNAAIGWYQKSSNMAGRGVFSNLTDTSGKSLVMAAIWTMQRQDLICIIAIIPSIQNPATGKYLEVKTANAHIIPIVQQLQRLAPRGVMKCGGVVNSEETKQQHPSTRWILCYALEHWTESNSAMHSGICPVRGKFTCALRAGLWIINMSMTTKELNKAVYAASTDDVLHKCCTTWEFRQ